MTTVLTADDFPTFFQEIHGYQPFPWQTRLLRQIAETGQWPDILDLPTGSGKTAALDVAVFHLALESDRGSNRRAPVRIAFVVDRRLVVDDAFMRAEKIADKLASAERDTVLGRVAGRLRLLAGKEALPLLARRLRGGIPREDSWARTPSQPTILCSTVDQVGSRLLFRGYGVSDRMKPIHAGLIGSDCLILLDEAHLSEPFRQTLKWVKHYKSESWHEDQSIVAPWSVALLTATPGRNEAEAFSLEEDDLKNEILSRRLNAPKPARLIEVSKSKITEEATDSDEEDGADKKSEDKRLVSALADKAQEALRDLQQDRETHKHPALAVVVNRVARARAVFEELNKRLGSEAECILLIGPSRQVEKDVQTKKLKPIYTGVQPRTLDKPLVIIATQCIEAGVDIDLDGLVTEIAPIDALRQRFGRLNRDGRETETYAAVLGGKTRAEDPVYGDALTETWKYLTSNLDTPATKKQKEAKVDFGLAAFAKRMDALFSDEATKETYKTLLSPRQDAPVLMPAHLDLLTQTSPVPAADPDVSLYLHGADRAADSVSVVWRADIDPKFREVIDARQLLILMPPRAAEAIELPLWTVRRWLTGQKAQLSTLADIPAGDFDENSPGQNGRQQMVFRWAGDDDRSTWISPAQIRPGDTIIVPAKFGGVDEYGWNPDSTKPATDVADKAVAPFEGRRFAVRVAPGLLGEGGDDEALANAIAANSTANWQILRDAVRKEVLSIELREILDKLDHAKGKRGVKVQVDIESYGKDENNRPRGVVFHAPFGLRVGKKETGDSPDTTEDDVAGSLPGFELSLEEHCRDVEKTAKGFAQSAGLPAERAHDLELAAYLHDSGKVDTRFQAWLAFGDPLGPAPENVLAKSARPLSRIVREQSKLPKHWRHEALSVRLAAATPRFEEARDKELVLWLIGTHHGHGRPFFPHTDPEDENTRTGLPTVLGTPSTIPPGHGPQSLAYDWNGLDWPGLYERLKIRYGAWELARMEAILRLADHRASEEAALKANEKETDTK
jgi:CRISPR-associated endonuclease/helicase Cas3